MDGETYGGRYGIGRGGEKGRGGELEREWERNREQTHAGSDQAVSKKRKSYETVHIYESSLDSVDDFTFINSKCHLRRRSPSNSQSSAFDARRSRPIINNTIKSKNKDATRQICVELPQPSSRAFLRNLVSSSTCETLTQPKRLMMPHRLPETLLPSPASTASPEPRQANLEYGYEEFVNGLTPVSFFSNAPYSNFTVKRLTLSHQRCRMPHLY